MPRALPGTGKSTRPTKSTNEDIVHRTPTVQQNSLSLFLAITLGLTALAGCESGGVGDPCTPEEEYLSNFAGFAVNGRSVEARSYQCETRICMVNNFLGRTTCPYGQVGFSQADVLAAEAENRTLTVNPSCKIPGTEDPIDPGVTVKPRLEERPPEDAVYCSCRCDGPDSTARYCECPGGFKCEELIKDMKLGSAQLAGSYCVRSGTMLADPAQAGKSGILCDRTSQNCED